MLGMTKIYDCIKKQDAFCRTIVFTVFLSDGTSASKMRENR